jgi:hypothetical protein
MIARRQALAGFTGSDHSKCIRPALLKQPVLGFILISLPTLLFTGFFNYGKPLKI